MFKLMFQVQLLMSLLLLMPPPLLLFLQEPLKWQENIVLPRNNSSGCSLESCSLHLLAVSTGEWRTFFPRDFASRHFESYQLCIIFISQNQPQDRSHTFQISPILGYVSCLLSASQEEWAALPSCLLLGVLVQDLDFQPQIFLVMFFNNLRSHYKKIPAHFA